MLRRAGLSHSGAERAPSRLLLQTLAKAIVPSGIKTTPSTSTSWLTTIGTKSPTMEDEELMSLRTIRRMGVPAGTWADAKLAKHARKRSANLICCHLRRLRTQKGMGVLLPFWQ